ncbi:MAG: hypothetical protein KGH59_00105 [Candidatus Micrarchaeota archaeon]|nr:hypothetical protein [Candidatus Micrarchaeota archaeon]MDE1846716.1 hypothetical protein [Candidatus Micrarchaeota archaeon]
MIASKILDEKTTPMIQYVSPSLATLITAPFFKGLEFNKFFRSKFKDNWVSFYEARNGLYHLLTYLKEKFGSSIIYLPTDICEVVKISAKLARYKIIYYAITPKGIKSKNVLLVTDNSIIPPKGVFSIEDNAKHPYYPNRRFDFTLYSFGASKPLSSSGGGVVVVNNREFRGFLKIRQLLKEPERIFEIRAWINYIRWTLIEHEPLHRDKRVIASFRTARLALRGNYMPTYRITNLPFRMMQISKKIAGKSFRDGEAQDNTKKQVKRS